MSQTWNNVRAFQLVGFLKLVWNKRNNNNQNRVVHAFKTKLAKKLDITKPILKILVSTLRLQTVNSALISRASCLRFGKYSSQF